MEYKLKFFRSGGFINKEYDMGRVYVDLPIAEARKLQADLNRDCPECDNTGEILLYDGSDTTGTIVDCEACNSVEQIEG